VRFAYGAAVVAAHDEAAAGAGALLVDAATHARAVDRSAPAIRIAPEYVDAVHVALDQFGRDVIVRHEHHGEPAADCVAGGARHASIDVRGGGATMAHDGVRT